MSILNDIKTLQDLGVANSAIKGALKKKGYSKEDIEIAIPTGEKRKCFVNDYYDYLAEAPRTLKEAEEYIMDESNSDNVRAYVKMHLNVAELAAAIWAAKA